MTFAKPNPKEKDENENSKAEPKPCSCCGRMTEHEQLMNLGARCFSCFKIYCLQAQPFIRDELSYAGDSKGWAKRIIAKHESDIVLNSTVLRFAKEALS
jgi:hypothetical protein